MKNFKYLFILTMIAMIGCSSDGDNEGVPETFLELNKGSIWKYTEDENDDGIIDGITYLKFSNNLNMPFESWGSMQNNEEDEWGCYSFFNFKLNQYNDPILFVETVENSQNKIVIQMTVRENHYQTYNITKSGEKLKIQIIGDEMGSSYGSTLYLEKTNDNIGSLEVCN